MIGIVDYGMGNLGSIANALTYLNKEHFIIRDSRDFSMAAQIILPGVGSFGKAIRNLRKRGLANEIVCHIREGKPFLGICLGYHLLFWGSQEGGGEEGLSVFSGKVVRFESWPGRKIPHVGWNSIRTERPNAFFSCFHGEYVYFLHSYFPVPEDPAIIRTHTSYGGTFTSAMERNNVLACQFHPEKSGRVGLEILKRWAERP